MSPSPDALRLPVHPHQLEVQEFGSYALILDLRSAEDFAQDHVPGAVNLPWEVAGDTALLTGSGAESTAQLLVADVGMAPTYALQAAVAGLNRGDAVLVYGGPGGIAAQLAAEHLRQAGLDVDELAGGYARYRRWVEFALDMLPRTLSLRWMRSPPGGGAQCVLEALSKRGAQTVSLAALCGQRLLPGLTLAGEGGVTQPGFDSQLVDALRVLDPARPVWVDEVLELSPAAVLPEALINELSRSPALRAVLPMEVRVALLRQRMADQGVRVEGWLAAVNVCLPAGTRSLEGGAEPVLDTVLREVIDPLYAKLAPNALAEDEPVLELDSSAVSAVMNGLALLPEPWGLHLDDQGDRDDF